MPVIREELIQDGSSLSKFVSSIADLCESRNGVSVHLASSEEFFLYIRNLATATKNHIADSVIKTDESNLLQLRKEIATLRVAWRFLHEFVKPCVDADTIRLPMALVLGLRDRFQGITRFRNSDFVLYHSDAFNYFNVKLDIFKEQANLVADNVGGPQFPENRAIIGFPYSQSSALFMNSLIPHELGHHVFSELSLRAKFVKLIEDELRGVSDFSSIGEYFPVLAEEFTSWLEEIFCDIFAVRLFGFSFSFAFVELFDVSSSLNESQESFLGAEKRAELDFVQGYPPDFLRLRQQISILKKDKWWPDVLEIESHYSRTLAFAEKLTDPEFSCRWLEGEAPLAIHVRRLLTCFFNVLPKLEASLEEATAGLKIARDQWAESAELIEAYLEQGVVPSTLQREEDGPLLIPAPVSLINSAYRFYLQSLPKLLDRIDDAGSGQVTDRAFWSHKVEEWTSKGIEDVLLTRAKEE
jgi:hypothetical protein